ncbi:DUF6875 domain-containing protein [Duganella sp. HH105]|uniref:DUF6875 domain-containing protein n=1 Tax=Duganella sp. HH105 TaxID=1781067 RepID=UPI0008930A75|nr:hypothetical protein [Duganella sp. HH105]OEZ63700.1 hypothetical protein DUGA6_02010 [Duganella sp. HH105]
MMTQKDPQSTQPQATCPMAAAHAETAAHPAASPRLMRVSEVDREYPGGTPLAQVMDWVRAFLARPHPDLGRKGAVCPFVPVSLLQDSIWLAEITDRDLSLDKISAIISQYRDLFLATEPTRGPDAINKAFMVVFPNLGKEGAAVVDEVQYRLKRDFVDMGLMLGEFHSANESEGLRNPEFRPLRSPIPMLAIRHMVDSDLPFLLRAGYPASVRAAFLRSYLYRMAGTLPSTKLEQALDGVIEAEVEQRIDIRLALLPAVAAVDGAAVAGAGANAAAADAAGTLLGGRP